MPSPCLVRLDAAESLPLAEAGGKAAGLARLRRLGGRVPEGWVIPAGVARRFLRQPRLRRALRLLRAAEAFPESFQRLFLDFLRLEIQRAPLPPELLAALGELPETERGFAVRSSGAGEDSAAASFAGIHRTLLGVRKQAELRRAVRACWASAWTPQALAYRRAAALVPRAGLQVASASSAAVGLFSPGLAVVIQELRLARAAGIAFTRDPVSGAEEVVLNAGRGPGEALVSGRAQPEVYRLAPAGEGWALREALPAGDGPLVLRESEAAEIAAEAARVAAALGEPQDVEWLLDEDGLWLVQARPLTRAGSRPLPPAPAPERPWGPDLWSNANVGEVLPGVVSPLTWSVVEPGLTVGLFQLLRRSGVPVPSELPLAGRFQGRVYFNLGALQWYAWWGYGLPPEETNRTMGGTHPALSVPPGSPWRGREGLRRAGRWLRAASRSLAALAVFPGRLRAAARFAAAEERRGLAPLADLDLAARFFSIGEQFGKFFETFVNVSGVSGRALRHLVDLLERWLPGQGEALAYGLVAGQGAITSAEHGHRLRAVAEVAREEPRAAAFLRRWREEPPPAEDWREALAGTRTGERFAAFLEEYGHRGVHELELAEPRWRESPAYLLRQVAAFLADPGGEPPAAAGETAWKEAVRRLAGRGPAWLTRPRLARLRWVARQYGRLAAQREGGKSALVRLVGLYRLLVLEIGRRLAARGQLAAPEDVFFLEQAELVAYLLGELDGAELAGLAAARREEVARWEREAPPAFFSGDEPPAPETSGAAAPLPDGAELAGLGVSGGRAAGRARVLRSPAEGHRLRAGEVLVAPSTDPAWTPLFLRAAALVLETGGLLSHGAIVAREYGLPAVANVPRATERIPAGAWVEVEADRGRVVVYREPPGSKARVESKE